MSYPFKNQNERSVHMSTQRTSTVARCDTSPSFEFSVDERQKDLLNEQRGTRNELYLQAVQSSCYRNAYAYDPRVRVPATRSLGYTTVVPNCDEPRCKKQSHWQ